MSAFVVIYERSSTPGDPSVFNRVMERLNHRGPDGSNALISGNVSMGHWHFWITPEEIGERQPLGLSGLPFKIVLDGRLDNRADLFAGLSVDPAEQKTTSDAALVLRSYARWGEDCFKRFVGEFAVVIFNEPRDELICARDALGERTLFYSWHGSRLVIASEPWAVAGAGDSIPELNEAAVAHYFAMRVPADGQTLFKDIREMMPAHVMLVNQTAQRNWRFWQPNPSKGLNGRSIEENAEEFRDLLEESIRCRMRSITPVGVLMSGGLDSTSVACLAARMLVPEPLTTISYVFDELNECDERQYIGAVKEKFPIRSIEINCDDAWTYKDWHSWPKDLNFPGGNPFRRLNERSYSCARKEGLRVLLTGGGADQLFSGGVDWFADLLGEGRILDAFRELSYMRNVGIRKFLGSGFIKSAVRHLFAAIPGGRYSRPRQIPPAWLSTLSFEFLRERKNEPASPDQKYEGVLGMGISRSYSSETTYASSSEIELRHPYRDRRLVDFILGIPSYQLYTRGMNKHILRTAMQGILPDAIRSRRNTTGYSALYSRGSQREEKFLQTSVQDLNPLWFKYIEPRWFVKHKDFKSAANQPGHEAMVPWLYVSYAAWHKSILSSGKC